MLRNLFGVAVLVLMIGAVGELVSPPLSCWISKSFGSFDPGRAGGPMMMQQGAGVVSFLRQVFERPAETSGTICRTRLAHAFGVG